MTVPDPEDPGDADRAEPNPLLAEVLSGQRSHVWSMLDGDFHETHEICPLGILSGSFNPLHEAHISLRAAAEKHLDGPVCYEMSIINADKPALDAMTVSHRCRQQLFDHPLALTREPTFPGKATVFPNTTFVVGVDTAERILLPRYYENRDDLMQRALQEFRKFGCRFLVAGRTSLQEFVALSDIAVPQEFEDLFEELPESEFRSDLSSTEIRQKRKNR